eukprot:c23328_g1_i1 orf=111-2210(+)
MQMSLASLFAMTATQMARFLGTGSLCLRQLQLLRSPISSTTSRRAAISEILLENSRFSYVRSYGDAAMFEDTGITQESDILRDNPETNALENQASKENGDRSKDLVEGLLDQDRIMDDKKITGDLDRKLSADGKPLENGGRSKMFIDGFLVEDGRVVEDRKVASESDGRQSGDRKAIKLSDGGKTLENGGESKLLIEGSRTVENKEVASGSDGKLSGDRQDRKLSGDGKPLENGGGSKLLIEGVLAQAGRVVEKKKVTSDSDGKLSGDRKPSAQTMGPGKVSTNLADVLLGSKTDSGEGKLKDTQPQKVQKPLKVNSFPTSGSKTDGGINKWTHGASTRGKAQQDSSKINKSSASQARPTVLNEKDDFADLGRPQETHRTGISSSSGLSGSSTCSIPKSVPNSMQFLADAVKRDSASGSVPSSGALVLKKTYERNHIQSSTNQMGKTTNLDYIRGNNLGSSSVTKAELDNPLSQREEPLAASIKNEAVSVVEDSGYSVCVENLPDDISLVRVKEALSCHGILTGSFRNPGKNGVSACHIEFQTEEAKESALAERWLFINGQQFPVSRLDCPMTTVVRISHVSPETTVNKVLSICEKCGKVDNVKRRERGLFDVFFKIRELPNMARILNGLNEVTINQSRWRAHPAPLVHPEVKESILQTRRGWDWYTAQVNRVLDGMNEAVSRYSIGVEDLKELQSMVK